MKTVTRMPIKKTDQKASEIISDFIRMNSWQGYFSAFVYANILLYFLFFVKVMFF